jgi:hypothetical protein
VAVPRNCSGVVTKISGRLDPASKFPSVRRSVFTSVFQNAWKTNRRHFMRWVAHVRAAALRPTHRDTADGIEAPDGAVACITPPTASALLQSPRPRSSHRARTSRARLRPRMFVSGCWGQMTEGRRRPLAKATRNTGANTVDEIRPGARNFVALCHENLSGLIEFRGGAPKFVPSGSPVFGPDIGPTQRLSSIHGLSRAGGL